MSKIYGQLLQFQNKLRKVNKDAKGYGYNYASFDNIIETIKPELEAQNLGYTHIFDGQDIICILFNAEGETITSRLSLSEEKPKLTKDGKETLTASQLLGVSITYARRYTLTAILGLVTDDDTDGVVNTPKTNKVVSQGQNQTPQDNKTKWFNLKTKDGAVIDKNYKYIIDNYAKGATSDKIIKALEQVGYTIHSSVKKEIEQMKIVDNYEEIVLVD